MENKKLNTTGMTSVVDEKVARKKETIASFTLFH